MARRATHKKQKTHVGSKREKAAMKRQGVMPLDMVKDAVRKKVPLHNPAELPANGEFGCAKCDMYFIDQKILDVHLKTKAHKKRLKIWNEKCHNQQDADRAAGLL